MILAAAILAGLVTLVLSFKLFFRDSDDFQECLDYVLKPDIVSWVSGDLGEDLWAQVKFSAWIGSAGIVGLGVYVGLRTLFG